MAEDIREIDYDYLIVATGYSDEVYAECIKQKLDLNRTIFLHNNKNYNTNVKNVDEILYTFEGFASDELDRDINAGYVTREWGENYRNTSEQLVMSKMKNPKQCIIKKGYFPETAEGLEETFSFVSIDVDLEEAIYNGLVYFYPRLSKGGYIFVHDYNSPLEGVKRAVKRYEEQYGRLCKAPLCDISGTLVVLK